MVTALIYFNLGVGSTWSWWNIQGKRGASGVKYFSPWWALYSLCASDGNHKILSITHQKSGQWDDIWGWHSWRISEKLELSLHYRCRIKYFVGDRIISLISLTIILGLIVKMTCQRQSTASPDDICSTHFWAYSRRHIFLLKNPLRWCTTALVLLYISSKTCNHICVLCNP